MSDENKAAARGDGRSGDVPFLEWVDASGKLNRRYIHDRLFIGRVCQGVPDEKRIVLLDRNVSRDHAVVTNHGEIITLRDTSKNGTRLNGVRVTSGAEQPLEDGCRLEIGAVEFRLVARHLLSTPRVDEDHAETQTLAINAYVTHLVADMRGFSGLSQRLDHQKMFRTMGQIFTRLSQVVHQYHGAVKDYAGDAIFAYWEHGRRIEPGKIRLAAEAALTQQQQLTELVDELLVVDEVWRELKFGWGISTGRVTLSHYGVRNDNVAIIGDSTNLAFRLSALANKELPAAIVACATTAGCLGEACELVDLGEVMVKGRHGTERVWGLQNCNVGR